MADGILTRADLEAVLQSMEQRLTAKIEATEAKLEQRLVESIQATEAKLEQRLVESIQATEAKLEALEQRLAERITDTETKLLTAFHGWARPTEVRIRGISTLVQGFDERLALLEERVSELERRRIA